LVSRGNRKLLRKILDAFFSRRESEHFAFAKAAFEYLIQHSQSKLALRAGDLLRYDESREERKTFVALLDQCLTIGASEQAMQLLEASSHELETAPVSRGLSTLSTWNEIVSDLLMPLALLLEKHGVSNSPLPVKRFFVAIIRGHLIRQLPASPLDWAHEPRRCELGQCGPCDALGHFLGSKTEKMWRFPADETSREHIEHVLSRHADCFEMTTECNTSPNTLTVVKRVKQASGDVNKYSQAVKSLRSALVPLKGDIMRNILGDDYYRQLICLESTKVKDNAKRQTDEVVLPLGKKPKIAEGKQGM
jgi:hypothetical protein